MNVQTDSEVVTEEAAVAAKKGKKGKRAAKAAMTPEAKALRQMVARSLWSVEMGKTSAARKDGTAKPFAEARAEFTAKAGLLLRSLQAKGVAMTVTAKAAAAEAE
ncbi:MAG: hypothetical protein ACRC14_08240 [Paracoccaceae bacterium]